MKRLETQVSRKLRTFLEGVYSAFSLYPGESSSVYLKRRPVSEAMASDWKHVGQDILRALEVPEGKLPLFDEQEGK